MTDTLPPNYSHATRTVSDVADNLKSARRSGGLLAKTTSGLIQRGEAYMDGSRILMQECLPLMNPDDNRTVKTVYNE